MKFMMTMAATAVALSGTLASVSEASTVTCSIDDVQYSSACIGRSPITGPPNGPNGSASEDDLEALDGGGWDELAKIEEGVTSTLFAFDIGSKDGFYTLFSPVSGLDYAVALKGGSGGGTNFFAAYLLTAADIAANLNPDGNLFGTFNMDAFFGLTGGGEGTPGLSNVVLFSRDGDDPSVIPLPAAGWLLLAGVGGLAAMRRKKKAA